jgi:D-alanyl-D-alanine carboxypeptidase
VHDGRAAKGFHKVRQIGNGVGAATAFGRLCRIFERTGFKRNFLYLLGELHRGEGRLRNRARAVAGQAWLKTGSLRDVSAIAGYAQSASGRRYAVVGIINHDNAGPARAALDALVQWVVQAP